MMSAMAGVAARLRRAHDWKRRVAHSLGARMVMLFLLLALASAALLFWGVRYQLGQGWEAWFQPLISDYVDRLQDEIGSPPSVARAQALTARLPIKVAIRGPGVNWSSHPQAQPGEPDGFDPWRRQPEGFVQLLTRRSADGHELRFGLAPQALLRHPHGWWMLLGLLALLALAYAAVRRMLRPLRAIGAGAEAFGRGEFDHRIELCRTHDELGDLAQRFNTMAGQIQRMLDGKRALLLAISHELRSPLTRARLHAELVDEGPARQALLDELGLMRDLINDLLESERLGSGHRALRREPCDLNALVRELVAARFAGEVALALELAPALPTLQLDRTRMQLLLRNLLDNALRHHDRSRGRVLLGTALVEGGVALTVRDFGPGVSEEELAHLGEPFYRPDAARTRASGGVGLGLSLCRLVAEAHGAPLLLRNAGPGLEVSVVLSLTA